VLPGTVGGDRRGFGALVEVSRLDGAHVDRGAGHAQGVSELGIVPGKPVYALVKAVSIDRHCRRLRLSG
jgi:ABC-type molybdate transport system ATPase subunit